MADGDHRAVFEVPPQTETVCSMLKASVPWIFEKPTAFCPHTFISNYLPSLPASRSARTLGFLRRQPLAVAEPFTLGVGVGRAPASCRLFWARRLCRVIAAHPSHCEHLYWGHVKIIPNLFLKSHGLSLTERDFQSQVTFIILTSILTTSSQILAISPNDGFVY